MRDVDEALARAFAAARPAHEHPHVPPPPHVAPPGASVAVANWPALVLTLERRHGDRFAARPIALVTIRDRQHRKLILFTSCHRAEGRTTLVLTLARAPARHPGAGRTVLVDTDFTGPMLARVLGLTADRGPRRRDRCGDAVAEAFVTLGDRLTLLPLRAAVPDPRRLLHRCRLDVRRLAITAGVRPRAAGRRAALFGTQRRGSSTRRRCGRACP